MVVVARLAIASVVSGSLVLVASAASSLVAQVPARVVLERDHITLEPGGSARIEATVVDAEGNPVDAKLTYGYVGRRTRRLDVDGRTGLIRAVKGGEYRVVVHVFDERFFAQVDMLAMFRMHAMMTVTVPYPAVERVEVAPGAGGTFYAGTVVRHHATVYDQAGDVRTNVEVEWSTSDEAVATIDRYGVFNAHAPGRVTLTATAEGVTREVVYDVAVSPVTSISLDASQEVGRTGDVIRFAAAPMAGDDGERRAGDLSPLSPMWTRRRPRISRRPRSTPGGGSWRTGRGSTRSWPPCPATRPTRPCASSRANVSETVHFVGHAASAGRAHVGPVGVGGRRRPRLRRHRHLERRRRHLLVGRDRPGCAGPGRFPGGGRAHHQRREGLRGRPHLRHLPRGSVGPSQRHRHRGLLGSRATSRSCRSSTTSLPAACTTSSSTMATSTP